MPNNIIFAAMLLYFSFFLSYFFLFVFGVQIGREVTAVSLPPRYEPQLKNYYSYFASTRHGVPNFKSAVSVEAMDGKYLCSLVVLLGDLIVWASDHHYKFAVEGKCVLLITTLGDMRLVDSFGSVGWSTDTTRQNVQGLELKENGNLVLLDDKSETKWQSFDHPGDILLKSQVLNVSSKLTSYISNTPYFYSFHVHQTKLALHLNSRQNPKENYLYWEFKPRTNDTITFVQLGRHGLNIYGPNLRKIAKIDSQGPDLLKLMALRTNGLLGLYYYAYENNSFEESLHKPSQSCDLPYQCGANGICTNFGSCTQFPWKEPPFCYGNGQCDGYCEFTDIEVEMKELDNVETKLETPFLVENVTDKECLNLCVENCSCVATMFNKINKECLQYGLAGGARKSNKGVGVQYWVKVLKVSVGGGGSGWASLNGFMKKVLLASGIVDGVAVCVIVGALVYYFRVIRKESVEAREDATN